MSELANDIGEAMVRENAQSLLKSKGNGVLSMGDDDRGYGLPISYGYDDVGNRIVLEFISGSESKKQRFAEQTTEVTLTVYNYESVDRWESVIVTGDLQPLPEGEVSERFASLFFSQAKDAVGEVRWIDWDDVERTWYEIRIAELTGRHSGVLLHKENQPDQR